MTLLHDKASVPDVATEPVASDIRGVRWLGQVLGARRRPWWVGIAIVLAAAAFYGLAAGWWTPRGPVTTFQVVAAIGLSLTVGVTAGVALRSRWAMLAAPVTFAAVFQLVRISPAGPLVGGIHLGSTYGFLAFFSGRGLHGMLALVPMLLGAAWGAGVARCLSGGRGRRGRGTAGLWSRRTGHAKLVGTLTGNGPPPCTNPLEYEAVLSNEQKVYPYDDTVNAGSAAGFSTNLFVREYSLLQQLHNLGAALDVFTVLYPQLQTINFRTQVRQLKVPVYLVQGRYETRGRAQPAREWFDLLQATTRQLITFDTACHRTLFEQPQRFSDLMTDTVLPQTSPSS